MNEMQIKAIETVAEKRHAKLCLTMAEHEAAKKTAQYVLDMQVRHKALNNTYLSAIRDGYNSLLK